MFLLPLKTAIIKNIKKNIFKIYFLNHNNLRKEILFVN